MTAEPGRLRIAFSSRPLLGHDVDVECEQGMQATVRLLEGLGHELVEASPAVDREAFSVAYLMVIAAETRDTIVQAAKLAGRKLTVADFEIGTRALAMLGQAFSAGEYAGALSYLQASSRGIARFCEEYDVLLTPTLARPPVTTGSLQPTAGERRQVEILSRLKAGWLMKALGVIKPLADKTFAFMPYTPVFNVTGQPAMSVPLHWTTGGLPVGMHFVGRFGDEATLFRLAGQLERAQPWFEHTPPGRV